MHLAASVSYQNETKCQADGWLIKTSENDILMLVFDYFINLCAFYLTMTTTKHPISLLKSGEASARAFIDEVLSFARERKVDQASLARRANISPESLSRMKKGGSCRLVTAFALARAAGFTTLEIASVTPTVASVVARKLSAGRRLPITGEELVTELRTGPTRHHFAHLIGFFEELPIESVHDVVLDLGLDYRHLAALARELGAEGETVEWLEEMAHDSVA